MRRPPRARSRARPVTSPPGSGSSSQKAASSRRVSATRSTSRKASGGDRSPGMRQPWLRSTMISMLDATAARTASTALRPSSMRFVSIRSFSAPNPCSRSASADSARSATGRRSPVEAYAGRASRAPPRSFAVGTPSAFPARSQRAASKGQYRPAWNVIVSSTLTCRSMSSGSCSTKSSVNRSKPSIVSPEPIPEIPSSVSTTTSVASTAWRGSGSQAAENGGSSG